MTRCALSVCTVPMLAVVLLGAGWQQVNQTLGIWAQEVFRGGAVTRIARTDWRIATLQPCRG